MTPKVAQVVDAVSSYTWMKETESNNYCTTPGRTMMVFQRCSTSTLYSPAAEGSTAHGQGRVPRKSRRKAALFRGPFQLFCNVTKMCDLIRAHTGNLHEFVRIII